MIPSRWLPAWFYFDRETEREFQSALNERSRSNLVIICLISVIALLSFVIPSFFDQASKANLFQNSFRLAVVVMFVVLAITTSKGSIKTIHQVWFMVGVLFCSLMGYFFVDYAVTHNELHEGGPMLAAIITTAIPILHLGHKMVLWCVFAISLFYIQLMTSVNIQ